MVKPVEIRNIAKITFVSTEIKLCVILESRRLNLYDKANEEVKCKLIDGIWTYIYNMIYAIIYC